MKATEKQSNVTGFEVRYNGQLVTLQTILYGGRALRRAIYRKYLRDNKVPKVIFGKISERMQFKKLNEITFIEDVRKQTPKEPQS